MKVEKSVLKFLKGQGLRGGCSGRSLKRIFQGGKSGLHRGGRRVTPGGSNPWKGPQKTDRQRPEELYNSSGAGKGEKVG